MKRFSTTLPSLVLALAAGLAMSSPARAQNCENPNLLIVLDRSISMQNEIGGRAMWDIARDAISALLQAHGNSAWFGLMIYPGPSGGGANGVEGPVGACRYNRQNDVCAPLAPRCTTGEVVVDCGPNTRNAIEGQLEWPQGLRHSYTPTWQSLAASNQYQRLRDPNRRNFVVLVTDGWQCCGLYLNADGSVGGCEPENRNLAVEQVEALRGSQIDTFVVGFGGQVDVQTLQRMAVAGGTARAGCDPEHTGLGGNQHCYYQANDHAALAGMLDDIVRRISVEICDGRDNDCDGRVDEGLTRACQTACGAGQERCVNGNWGNCDGGQANQEVCNGLDDDCDGRVDEGLVRACNSACGRGEERCVGGAWRDCDAQQPEAEVCDGTDNDCDGTVDEGCDCAPGDTRPCGDDVGACRAGTQRCRPGGAWSNCEGGVGPSPEICDGIDNDCDGEIDNFTEPCQGACGAGQRTCLNGAWSECEGGEGRPEVCNGLDDDCDGRVDENLTRPCETLCGTGVEFCHEGEFDGCTARQPVNEICGNGIDDDCDGQVDEDCDCQDGDTQPCGSDLGICEAGTQTCAGGAWGACVGAVEGQAESCNGLDDNCDGRIDEGDLCDNGEICGCGACAAPCEFGECPGEAQCVFGHCIVDNCPPGFVCDGTTCIPGERPDADGVGLPDLRLDGGAGDGTGSGSGSGASDGCNCDVAGSGSSGLGWLALIGLLGLRRRRRA